MRASWPVPICDRARVCQHQRACVRVRACTCVRVYVQIAHVWLWCRIALCSVRVDRPKVYWPMPLDDGPENAVPVQPAIKRRARAEKIQHDGTADDADTQCLYTPVIYNEAWQQFMTATSAELTILRGEYVKKRAIRAEAQEMWHTAPLRMCDT